MSNVQRVRLTDAVADVIEQAGPNVAFQVMETAYEIQQREQRAMSLEEALRIVRGVASGIEEMYQRSEAVR